MKGNPWTKEEKEFVEANYQDMTDKEMAEHIDRTYSAINAFRQREGLVNKDRYWEEDEVEILKQHYADTPKEKMLELLPGKSIGQIYGKANSMGLKKDEEFLKKQNQQLGKQMADSEASKATRFDSGHEPFNKGMSQDEYMSQEAIEKTKGTRFKPGQAPPTAKWDGAITIRRDSGTNRPYLWIRISESNWKKYHVYRWEKENGDVPEDHIIVFKDGNSLNTHPSNLEAITRAEHAIRNQNREKAAKSLKEYWENNPHPARELTDNYVAGLLAGGDKELRQHLIEERQDLIRVARANYKLKRQINNGSN